MDELSRFGFFKRGLADADKVADFMAPVFDVEIRTSKVEICFKPEDVAIVIHESSHSDEGYGQRDIVAVYILKDGRFATVSAWCDTSGFG